YLEKTISKIALVVSIVLILLSIADDIQSSREMGALEDSTNQLSQDQKDQLEVGGLAGIDWTGFGLSLPLLCPTHLRSASHRAPIPPHLLDTANPACCPTPNRAARAHHFARCTPRHRVGHWLGVAHLSAACAAQDSVRSQRRRAALHERSLQRHSAPRASRSP